MRTLASVGPLLVKTGFTNYDVAMNPYVGCEFGCKYCYVRFFIKDKDHAWGDFVRIREFVSNKLPKELKKGVVKTKKGCINIQDARLVMGTMTDPYQPVERHSRITRKMLEILLDDEFPQFKKVGIFTRSPIILEDLDLIKRLPSPHVHFTITPFPSEAKRLLELTSSQTKRRWDTVRSLKESGIRVHCNISPIIPMLSEQYIEDFVEQLVALKVDEYFVDPVQPYRESVVAMAESCKNLEVWPQIEEVISNKLRYLEWKANFLERWNEHRKYIQHLAPDQTPVWCDHENKVWVDMRTI